MRFVHTDVVVELGLCVPNAGGDPSDGLLACVSMADQLHAAGVRIRRADPVGERDGWLVTPRIRTEASSRQARAMASSNEERRRALQAAIAPVVGRFGWSADGVDVRPYGDGGLYAECRGPERQWSTAVGYSVAGWTGLSSAELYPDPLTMAEHTDRSEYSDRQRQAFDTHCEPTEFVARIHSTVMAPNLVEAFHAAQTLVEGEAAAGARMAAVEIDAVAGRKARTTFGIAIVVVYPADRGSGRGPDNGQEAAIDSLAREVSARHGLQPASCRQYRPGATPGAAVSAVEVDPSAKAGKKAQVHAVYVALGADPFVRCGGAGQDQRVTRDPRTPRQQRAGRGGEAEIDQVMSALTKYSDWVRDNPVRVLLRAEIRVEPGGSAAEVIKFIADRLCAAEVVKAGGMSVGRPRLCGSELVLADLLLDDVANSPKASGEAAMAALADTGWQIVAGADPEPSGAVGGIFGPEDACEPFVAVWQPAAVSTPGVHRLNLLAGRGVSLPG